MNKRRQLKSNLTKSETQRPRGPSCKIKKRTPKTRERILVEASKLFSRLGYVGTSTQKIADAVGITQPGVYRHFASKADIVVAIGAAILDPLIEIVERESKLGNTSSIELARLVRAICYERAHSNFSFQLFISGYRMPEIESVWIEYQHLCKHVERAISRGVKSGEFRKVPVRVAQEAIMTLTDLVVYRSPGKTEDHIDLIVSFAIRGLLFDPSSSDSVLSKAYITRPESNVD